MKKSEKWMVGGMAAGLLAFWWALSFNHKGGHMYNEYDIEEMIVEPRTFFFLLLVSTVCYGMQAWELYKELKQKGRKTTGIIAASFIGVGALSLAGALYYGAYGKYEKGKQTVEYGYVPGSPQFTIIWGIVSLLLLFVAPHAVIALKNKI